MMTDVMDFARAREIYGTALTRYFRQARVRGESRMIDARGSILAEFADRRPEGDQLRPHSAKSRGNPFNSTSACVPYFRCSNS